MTGSDSVFSFRAKKETSTTGFDIGQMLYCLPTQESSFKWPRQRVYTLLTTTTKSSGYTFTRHRHNYRMLYKAAFHVTNHSTHPAKVALCQATHSSKNKQNKTAWVWLHKLYFCAPEQRPVLCCEQKVAFKWVCSSGDVQPSLAGFHGGRTSFNVHGFHFSNRVLTVG